MICKFRFNRFAVKSWIDINSVIIENLLIMFPFMEACQIILPHNEIKVVLWKFFFQIDEGMNGVVGLR